MCRTCGHDDAGDSQKPPLEGNVTPSRESDLAVVRHVTGSRTWPLRWRLSFPGTEDQISAARSFTDLLLTDFPGKDDAVWIAGELGANAVLWTRSGKGGTFDVEIARDESWAQVAVIDDGSADAPVFSASGPCGNAEHGRGLYGVMILASRYGSYRTLDGRRVVWALIGAELHQTHHST